MKSCQISSLFRKWYNRAAKVLKITAYVISCDVIGHDTILYSDIAFERYGLKLCVLQVTCSKYYLVAICRRFPESLFSQKFVFKSQTLTLKSLRIQDPRIPLRMVPLMVFQENHHFKSTNGNDQIILVVVSQW